MRFVQKHRAAATHNAFPWYSSKTIISARQIRSNSRCPAFAGDSRATCRRFTRLPLPRRKFLLERLHGDLACGDPRMEQGSRPLATDDGTPGPGFQRAANAAVGVRRAGSSWAPIGASARSQGRVSPLGSRASTKHESRAPTRPPCRFPRRRAAYSSAPVGAAVGSQGRVSPLGMTGRPGPCRNDRQRHLFPITGISGDWRLSHPPAQDQDLDTLATVTMAPTGPKVNPSSASDRDPCR
jgi:hypothetical protein